MILKEIVNYRGDRLFQGAVNVDWVHSNPSRASAAAESFVFHGPAYHGVAQEDVGSSHGHRLQDTASFALSIVKRCYGLEDEPFTLAIAGYGTGKSHLGLTLASLLGDPTSKEASAIISNLRQADPAIGSEIEAILAEEKQPCLVVAVNGMGNFDLTAEVAKQLLQQVKERGLDSRPLDVLRPRFAQAATLLRIAATNQEVVEATLDACQVQSIEEVLQALEDQEEDTYSKVHQVLASRNLNLSAFGGESLRDVIEVASREYCGQGKTFRSIAVLFDEFGRYTEFATNRSYVAGSGVLQDLFEAIQGSSGRACFAGFIQFELNAYVQRVAPELRNEILRYVTRYQGTKRVYLSINLETLIASLLEKRRTDLLDEWFDTGSAKEESKRILDSLRRWFPQLRQHRLWDDPEQFHTVVRKGCWPLSPFSTWLLYHFAAAGKHLQSRSALAFLGDTFDGKADVSVEDASHMIHPIDFWSADFRQELFTAEDGGQLGMIAHACASVEARHGANLDGNLKLLLRAIVLGSKLGLKSVDKDDAIEALSELSGLHLSDADAGIKRLLDEYNVIAWDDAFKQFEILGDSAPRAEFLSFLRKRVASAFDDTAKAALFASKAKQWCDLVGDLDSEFAEENSINSREWRYAGYTTNSGYIAAQIKLASDRWVESLGVDEPRGTVIYSYVAPSSDPAGIAKESRSYLKKAAQQVKTSVLPILVVLLHDEEGTIGQNLAELSVLSESLTEEEKARFQNLVSSHIEKCRELLRLGVENAIKKRNYVTGTPEPLESSRLVRAGTELFTKIYRSPIAFPFDGFGTARGNAADSCRDLTIDLLSGKLDFDSVMSKPVKEKNRALTVLRDSWGIFNQSGKVRTRPTDHVLQDLTVKWDEKLNSEKRQIDLVAAIRGLCAPPYGANIASAGLFLGVFIAARYEKLVVLHGDQQISVKQWLQKEIFRSKYIDIGALRDTALIHLGEESSEWDTLLDEWEEENSHLGRVTYLRRAMELAQRVPVPPLAAVRKVQLEGLSRESQQELDRAKEKESQAMDRIERGMLRRDVSQLSWGAATLHSLCETMEEESPLWTESQIKDLQDMMIRTRESIPLHFSDWLARQGPDDGTVAGAGQFRHKMIQLVGGNLKKLGLSREADLLEKRTNDLIRDIETVAEASQVVTEVKQWLTSHSDATKFVRVAALRALREVGKNHANKLQGLAARIQRPDINETRALLSQTLDCMKSAEEAVMKRAERLWKSKLLSGDDIESVSQEVMCLIGAFEGCATDLGDLDSMRKALSSFRTAYKRLSDENLSWTELESLANELKDSLGSELSEEELPWQYDEVIEEFVAEVTKSRKAWSTAWIEKVELEVAHVTEADTGEANQLHARIKVPPVFLTEAHEKRRHKVIGEVEKRLNSLLIEWLVEKFKELPSSQRKEFLRLAASL